MKNKDIEEKIRLETKGEIPNVLNEILLNCKTKKEKINETSNINNYFKYGYIAFASIVLIFLIQVIAFNKFENLNIAKTTVEIDVNPSIELKLNKNEKIIKASALNNDGKKILKGLDLNGSSLNIGVHAIIGSMYKNGYIDELKNSVLISVKNDDIKLQEQLQKKLSEEISEVLNTYSISPSVLTQEYKSNNNTEKLAKENGISNGKAEFIDKIIKSKLTNKNGKVYTFEELSNLNINELNVILNSKNKDIENVNISGKASTKKYIGESIAKDIAIKDSNEKSITNLEIELDYENGIFVYEVSFDAGRKEYDYEIDAISGKIIDKEVEVDDDNKTTKTTQSKSSSSSSSKNSSSNTSSSSKNNIISRSKAKSIALNNASVKESNIRDLSIELDYENGKYIYEVSFDVGRKEYDYDIDAKSGKILKKEIDIDD